MEVLKNCMPTMLEKVMRSAFTFAPSISGEYKLETVARFLKIVLAAAKQLAAALSEYRGKQPLVLAIPKGVPMAKVITDELDGDLDVVLVRKLRRPVMPNLLSARWMRVAVLICSLRFERWRHPAIY